jgi:hypothetical protein
LKLTVSSAFGTQRTFPAFGGVPVVEGQADMRWPSSDVAAFWPEADSEDYSAVKQPVS